MTKIAGHFRTIRKLMKQSEWQAAERLLLHELAQAGRNRLRAAECYSNLGNVAEAQHRVGDAFRYWSLAIHLLNRLRLTETPEADRLRRLIRLWHENPRVWVSYSRHDQERVEAVLRVLRRSGIEVMCDMDFAPGHSIQRQILSAIARCPKYVVFWSARSRDSGWVLYEQEILRTVKRQRRRDHSIRAWDNVVIFYCLDGERPKNEMGGDLQIVEAQVGFASATKSLIRGIKASEILANFGCNTGEEI